MCSVGTCTCTVPTCRYVLCDVRTCAVRLYSSTVAVVATYYTTFETQDDSGGAVLQVASTRGYGTWKRRPWRRAIDGVIETRLLSTRVTGHRKGREGRVERPCANCSRLPFLPFRVSLWRPCERFGGGKRRLPNGPLGSSVASDSNSSTDRGRPTRRRRDGAFGPSCDWRTRAQQMHMRQVIRMPRALGTIGSSDINVDSEKNGGGVDGGGGSEGGGECGGKVGGGGLPGGGGGEGAQCAGPPSE